MIHTNADMRTYLESRLTELFSNPNICFRDLSASVLPKEGGVYVISQNNYDTLYVGRTKNLRNRLYSNHLMGDLSSASLKRYLIDEHFVNDKKEAKKFIKERCGLRFVLEDDYRKRGALEGFLTGVLFPKFGIDEEH